MKNKTILEKILFYIQLIALILLGLCVLLFIWSVFLNSKGEMKIIIFNLVGDSLLFILSIIFFSLEFIYALLFGIVKNKIHITFLSPFILILIGLNLFYFALGYEEIKYKVEIDEINESLIVTEYSSIHTMSQIVYQKKFFIFYKEIFYVSETNLSNPNDSKIYFENDCLYLEYYDYYINSSCIKIIDYKANEFILKK